MTGPSVPVAQRAQKIKAGCLNEIGMIPALSNSFRAAPQLGDTLMQRRLSPCSLLSRLRSARSQALPPLDKVVDLLHLVNKQIHHPAVEQPGERLLRVGGQSSAHKACLGCRRLQKHRFCQQPRADRAKVAPSRLRPQEPWPSFRRTASPEDCRLGLPRSKQSGQLLGMLGSLRDSRATPEQ